MTPELGLRPDAQAFQSPPASQADVSGEDYAKLTINSANPVARFAQRTRVRKSIEIIEAMAPPGAAILDFGCNDGRMLSELRARGWTGALMGFDPFTNPRSQDFLTIADLAEIPDASLDAVTAFETLEHVDDEGRRTFMEFCARALKPTGQIIVSVPIMIGPVLFVKYANARFVNKSRWRYSFKELLSGLFGGSVRRSKTGDFLDHKGFDFRELDAHMRARFKMRRRLFSPFSWAGWIANSQVFLIYLASSI